MAFTRPKTVYSLDQAMDSAPGLALLRDRIQASQRCLEQVLPLIPGPLRAQVRAGPLQDEEWCLLSRSSAASAKLRQLLPVLQQELTRQGSAVQRIRIKIQVEPR